MGGRTAAEVFPGALGREIGAQDDAVIASGIGIAGKGLTVSARCPQDGVVEAVESKGDSGIFVLGVQWHPERTFATSPSSRLLFTRFVQAAAAVRVA